MAFSLTRSCFARSTQKPPRLAAAAATTEEEDGAGTFHIIANERWTALSEHLWLRDK